MEFYLSILLIGVMTFVYKVGKDIIGVINALPEPKDKKDENN